MTLVAFMSFIDYAYLIGVSALCCNWFVIAVARIACGPKIAPFFTGNKTRRAIATIAINDERSARKGQVGTVWIWIPTFYWPISPKHDRASGVNSAGQS